MPKPFQPLLALVLYVPRCLLLSAVDPFGTGGHGDPNRGTLPGETGHQYVTVDFPPLYPPPLSFIPLSFSYFIPLSSCFYSFNSLPFPLGFFRLLPLSWEWPSPKKQPHSGGPHIYLPGPATWDRNDRTETSRLRKGRTKRTGGRVDTLDWTFQTRTTLYTL